MVADGAIMGLGMTGNAARDGRGWASRRGAADNMDVGDAVRVVRGVALRAREIA